MALPEAPSALQPTTPASPAPVPASDPIQMRKLEMGHELIRVGLLVLGACAFAYFGQMELASSFVGAALTLLRPKNIGGPGPLAMGLGFGAGMFALETLGLGVI